MKGGRTPTGYTIVEVMIVLAISGVMFLLATKFINGKQESATFPLAVQTLATNIENTIKEVTNGNYTDVNLQCTTTIDGATGNPEVTTLQLSGINTTTTNSGSTDQQGTNQDCVYLGKIMHFWVQGVGTPPNPNYKQEYETVSLAGARLDADGIPIGPDSSGAPYDQDAPTVISSLTNQAALPYSLTVLKSGLAPSSGPTSANNTFTAAQYPQPSTYAIGFLQNLGTTNTPTQNGAQPVSLYYISGLTNKTDQNGLVGAISAGLNSSTNGMNILPLPPGKEFAICVTDSQQYAYIELGSENSNLQVNVRMLGKQAGVVPPC